MKRSIFTLFLAFFTISVFGQLNMNQLGYLDMVSNHNSDLSDVWGYVDENGNEYAIVGLNNGTAIVDVTDPANPVEIFYEPGSNSVWRDIKTWGDYAYVTTEGGDGLLIIDMTPLPASTSLPVTYYFGDPGNQWSSAHNLYIDENGVCYIFGAESTGGAFMYDVATNPTNPSEIGIVNNWYAHDGVARGDTLYMGHINDGHMSIFDVSNKSNPILLGTANTPSFFSHNVWFSDNGNYLFTTDEVSNGYLGAYDITDPTDITELDRIQSSPGMNVIPHNTHFINNYIVTSYYRDGVTIHDVTNPANMIEVGNFDTSPLDGDGYNGCWGVYPWLPSGNIIATDIEEGLFIVGFNDTRGCYLEGNVTDASNSAPIGNASIEIIGQNITDNTVITGDYSTGLGTSGAYDVVCSKPGYVSDTAFNVNLSNGNLVIQDFQLQPVPSTTMTGQITDAFTGNPIVGAMVSVSNADFDFNVTTDGSGNFSIQPFYEGIYDITVGSWGHVTTCETGVTFTLQNATYDAQLQEGWYDDFSFNYNWIVSGNATAGLWERANPKPTESFGFLYNPGEDVSTDCNGKAYVTGNNDASVGADDVDDGLTILSSPIFDLSSYNDPKLYYSRWFVNGGGSGQANDSMHVYIDNGTETVLLEVIGQNQSGQTWTDKVFRLNNYISSTATMSLIVSVGDYPGGHLVEGGLDKFYIQEADPTAITDNYDKEEGIAAYPNPFDDDLFIQLNITETITIHDVTGKIVKKITLPSGVHKINTSDLKSGIYILTLPNGTFKKLVKK